MDLEHTPTLNSQLQEGACLGVHFLGFLWHRQSGHLSGRLPLVRCYPGNEWVPSTLKLLTLLPHSIHCLFRVPTRSLPLLCDSGNAVPPTLKPHSCRLYQFCSHSFLLKGLSLTSPGWAVFHLHSIRPLTPSLIIITCALLASKPENSHLWDCWAG